MSNDDPYWQRGPGRPTRRPVRAPHRTTQVRAMTEVEKKARWLREHGVTAEEFEAKKGDAEWLDRIKRRGRIA